MDDIKIIKLRRNRNELTRKRIKTEKDTKEHRLLTARIQNLDEYIKIAKTEHTAQGS